MSKKTDTLTDFDKQLIAGMEEVVAHINGAPNNGRATVVEFAASQLVSNGTPTPNITLGGTSLIGTFGLAFQPHASGLPIKE